jgi:protein-disulfide isomerase
MKKFYAVATASILLVGVFLGATLFYQQQQAEEAQNAAARYAGNLEPEYAATKGDPNAKVTIVKFFDPACEACKAFHPLVERILNENPGKVRLVMRYAPLHAGSDYVSALLEAAKQQGKFWETLEAAYDAQSKWAAHGNPQPKRIWMQLGSAGLNLKKAEAAMQSQEVLENVRRDVEEARRIGVNKTPTFYVNGRPLQQFGYQQLRDLVETEIRNAY